MDSIFGIGTPELIVILIIAGIVMGPERIARVARWLGQTTAQLQNISRGFMNQLRNEIDSVDSGEMKEMLHEMRSLQKEVTDLRKQVTSVATSTIDETKELVDTTVQESKEAFESFSIQPPTLGADEGSETAVNGHTNGSAPPPPPAPSTNQNTHQPPKLPKVVDVADDPEN